MNNFSAFKLFYDELIYKRNGFVPFANVYDRLENIRKNVDTVRKCSKIDIPKYMSVLKKANKSIKEDLENILRLNKPLMQFYFLLYKARIEECNDKLEDIPLIVSNSFYSDYRLDDKTPLELELNNNSVPRYSSLEKKEIREKASSMTSLEYFISLLKDSEESRKYKTFLEKIKNVMELLPLYNENHYVYFNRIEPSIRKMEKEGEKLEDKARQSDDYEIITVKMKIAYKIKFDVWSLGIVELLSDYFDHLFEKKENDLIVRDHFNIANKIPYSSYMEIVTEIEDEKRRLDELYDNNVFEEVTYYGDTYLFRIRELLINSYYDKRYKLEVVKGDLDSYVKEAINLYSLASDLEKSIFDYYVYLSSHSKELKRNNDVESAILANIFETYSPLKSLNRFDTLRREFSNMINKESNAFKKKYNTVLLDKRVEYGFKGPIPNKASINVLLNERCKKFIVENCLDNLINFDVTGLYDTRNFDLAVLCQKFSFDDLLELYSDLKAVYANFPNAISLPQKFICETIYNRLEYSDPSLKEKNDRLKVICQSYLKEEPLFV